MRISLLGFGLIGGSIARALAARGHTEWTVTAWSPSEDGTRLALRQGTIAARAPDPETCVKGADLVVLAAPPLANLELLDRVAPLLVGTDATLTDVSSTKTTIARRADEHAGLHFVGGHPMSGRERRGYTASTADLFVGRAWVIVPGSSARPRDVARVRELAAACHAAPLELDAETHDEAVASISHLPLVVSVALAETVASDPGWSLARRLAAQGWRDVTRLARGDAALGAGILTTNASATAAWLRRYRESLGDWQRLLDELAASDGDPADRVASRLSRSAALIDPPGRGEAA